MFLNVKSYFIHFKAFSVKAIFYTAFLTNRCFRKFAKISLTTSLQFILVFGTEQILNILPSNIKSVMSFQSWIIARYMNDECIYTKLFAIVNCKYTRLAFPKTPIEFPSI